MVVGGIGVRSADASNRRAVLGDAVLDMRDGWLRRRMCGCRRIGAGYSTYGAVSRRLAGGGGDVLAVQLPSAVGRREVARCNIIRFSACETLGGGNKFRCDKCATLTEAHRRWATRRQAWLMAAQRQVQVAATGAGYPSETVQTRGGPWPPPEALLPCCFPFDDQNQQCGEPS